jgi:[ribosomal protein S5]-alanine N-acetyltransferase
MLIRTNRPGCDLRPWKAEDKTALVSNANSRNVWRNLTEMFPHPYTEADAENWVATANQSEPSVHLAIALEGKAVGGIGVVAGEGVARHTAQFGYWLGESYWGRGIATAAARAMVAHVFSGSYFVRLEAAVFVWNPASMRILEKVGFVREGVLRKSVFKDGEFIDSVMYALVRVT